MNKSWSYFFFLLWVVYLLTGSILLFSRGFLLSRMTQDDNSTCLPLATTPCTYPNSRSKPVTDGNDQQCFNDDKLTSVLENVKDLSRICLPPRAKVVCLLIDALRYDFALYNETIKNPLSFQNRLPVISKIVKEYPDSSRLYKFVADPPTTTMQRLKGLTTGSLPTFIDAGSNFASYEITEDNIIDQLVRNNQTVVFMGDDTWMGLFPNRFARAYSYPSFDVSDLDLVDRGVTTNLYPELKKLDWKLLIGHFLGVDHCGHRFGPNHPEMIRKLGEMNTMIETVVDQMDEETILMVFGDHGMTNEGDHGGGTDLEVTSALFVYSKMPLLNLPEESLSVKQVNLVPTLSAILGVPIPFSNLGSLILNVMPKINHTNIPEWQFSLHSLWSNVEQITNYIKMYSKNSDVFEGETLKPFYEEFAHLKSKIYSVNNEGTFEEFQRSCIKYIIDLRLMCEKVWVQFDAFSMSRGLVLFSLTLFFIFVISDGVPANCLHELFMSPFLLCSYLALFGVAIITSLLYYVGFFDHLMASIFFFTGVVSQLMLVLLIVQNWEIISLHWHSKREVNKISNLICRLVLGFNLCGVFSNSYIVEEGYVLLFLLVTVTLSSTFGIIQNVASKKNLLGSKWLKYRFLFFAVSVSVLVRFTMYFWRCRSEQEWCLSSHDVVQRVKDYTTKTMWAFTLILLGLFVTVTKTWMKNCGNLNGFSVTVTLAKYSPTVIVVCTGCYWVLHRLPADTKNRLSRPWEANFLAWIVYAVTSGSICITILKPLLVYIIPRKQETTMSKNSNIIPHLFNKIKEGMFKENVNDDVPIICGLGTVYSTAYLTIGIYMTLLFALLLGDAEAPAAVIMFVTVIFILIVSSTLRIEKATTIEQLLDIPNVSILVWVIISQYFFYGSGHQPTFTNIDWNSAFIGTSGILTYNFIPGTLVIMNTFFSYILMGFLLPLTVITPFTLFVMVPSVVSRNKFHQLDQSRGELILFEMDKQMFTNVFIVCCKYIVCHGIRVFATMLAATIHCRHLMVWSIFAPKFIFEGIGMLVTLGSVTLAYLLLIRINYKIENFVIKLNKQHS